MANLFDYLHWRGDLPFCRDSFNDIDAVILSRLSYLPFDGIVAEDFDSAITVEKAAEKFFLCEQNQNSTLWKGDDELLKLLGKSDRFKDLRLTGFVNTVDEGEQMQFCALSILCDDMTFISFRGTDNTLVGWQEDFNMYYIFPLPSQKTALSYLEQAASRFDGKIITGGHSKGGNLAVYSAAMCDEKIRGRIEAVYSMDGPGFEKGALKNSAFEEIKERIHTYMPQSSIFGMMLEHNEDYTIIESTQKGFFQHDVYSWVVDVTRLHELESFTKTEAFFDHTLTDFAESLSVEERRQFSEGIFNILKSTENKTFDEYADNLLKSIGNTLKGFAKIDSQTRTLILSSVARFVKAAAGNISDIRPRSKKK